MDVVAIRAVRAIEELDDAEPVIDGVEQRAEAFLATDQFLPGRGDVVGEGDVFGHWSAVERSRGQSIAPALRDRRPATKIRAAALFVPRQRAANKGEDAAALASSTAVADSQAAISAARAAVMRNVGPATLTVPIGSPVSGLRMATAKAAVPV